LLTPQITGENESPETEVTTLAPPIIPGGFDTIHISFSGHWHREAWEDNCKQWDAAQAAARDDDTAGAITTPEGELYQVQPYGEGAGIRRRWVFTLLGGTRVGIVNRQRYNERQISVAVQIKSDALMLHGPEYCYQQVVGFLKALGFQRQSESLGRVDACIDQVGVDISEYAPLKEGCILGLHLAKKGESHTMGSRYETIQQGKETKVRIYNKIAETAHKPEKCRIMVERRWGHEPQRATRVEWEVRRERLRSFGIKTFRDLMDKQAEFVEWCVKDFVRMTDRPVDRKNNNQQRAKLHPLWVKLIEQVELVYGQPQDILPRIKPGPSSLKQDEAHTIGMLAKLAARSMTTEVSVEAMVEWLREWIPKKLDKITQRAADKQTHLAFETALGPPIDSGEIPF